MVCSGGRDNATPRQNFDILEQTGLPADQAYFSVKTFPKCFFANQLLELLVKLNSHEKSRLLYKQLRP